MGIRAYKGFNKDMTCRGFQFKEGETYHVDNAKLCERGFHACLNPLDCFTYYDPVNSEYHEVEIDDVTDEHSDDSKICGKTVKINAKLDIAGIVKAQIEVIKSKIQDAANSATGNWSANSATGYGSANSATGYGSANSATGDRSANSATGDRSANSATGYWSANSATGDRSANSATGYGSANISTGLDCKNNAAKGSISIGWGKDNKCKGDIGSYIVLVERGEWDGEKYPQIGEPKLKKVDGKTIKPDTWYTLKDGKFVEVDEGE